MLYTMNVKPLIKDEMLVVRVTSALKATLQRTAKGEHRPLANLVEHILLSWIEQQGDDPEAAERPAGGGAAGNQPRQRLPRNAADAPPRRPRQKHPPRQRKGP